MTTDRLQAYRGRLLSLPDSLDADDMTDAELAEARTSEFLFAKDDPAWRALMQVVLEKLRQQDPDE